MDLIAKNDNCTFSELSGDLQKCLNLLVKFDRHHRMFLYLELTNIIISSRSLFFTAFHWILLLFNLSLFSSWLSTWFVLWFVLLLVLRLTYLFLNQVGHESVFSHDSNGAFEGESYCMYSLLPCLDPSILKVVLADLSLFEAFSIFMYLVKRCSI